MHADEQAYIPAQESLPGDLSTPPQACMPSRCHKNVPRA